ncbi:MAG TPA: TonB-dependent receptor [Steroidobacteraceae bacterium]|nr:TonB-dependent receptor [Steroidobacteraceae bacterium]
MQSTSRTRRKSLHGLTIATTLAATVFAASARAQTTSSEQGSQQLQEVVVTGSLIKRTDVETPSPVQIISAEDLKNSGYVSVNDVLRNLASNGQGTLNQGFTEAFAAGASGVALRGLTVGDTLTLIDSERMVAYPLSDDGERSFVDTTAIPFNVVESIEVLKDGASALYGADAIAGVVNIKLKPTYEGAELTAEGGATQHNDGWTWHAAGIAGWGNLASDGYNIYMALDWHRQELIWGSSRNGPWTQLNWSGYPNGINETPGSPAGPTTQSLYTYPDSIQGYVVNPMVTPANATQPAATFFKQGPQPGCNSVAAQAAGACEFSFPGQIQPPTEQTNFLAKWTQALGGDWKMTWTASIFDSAAEQVAPETPPFGHALNQTGINVGSVQTVNFGPGVTPHLNIFPIFTLPANSTLNPYGVPAQFAYTFPDIGPNVIDTETTTYRLFADFRGTAAGWDLDAAVGLMYAKASVDIYGYIEPAVAQADLNNLTYVPGVTNNGAQLFAPVETTDPSSTLDVVDLHGSHQLFQMPGGPLTLAVGAQYFHKAQNDPTPASVASGVQSIPGSQAVYSVGSQDNTAAFLEVGGKLVKQLEFDAAVRYDHYDTYGGQATPKFGLKYTPIDMLSLRGTWGKGFRAPSISEAGDAGVEFGEGNIPVAGLCTNGQANQKGNINAYCAYPAIGISVANPDLKAVTSKNATLGVIFEPSQAFNVSADYYWIQLNNDIISASAAGGLGAPFLETVPGPPTKALVCTNNGVPGVNGGLCPQAPVIVTPPAYTLVPYVNAGITTTSGFDIDVRGRLDLGAVGRLTGDIQFTRIIEYEYGYQGTTFDLVGTHGPSSISGDTGNPRDRAVLTLTWDKGAFSSTLTGNYTSSFHITDPSAGYLTCAQALASGAPSAYGPAFVGTSVAGTAWVPYCSVAHFTSWNLYANYAATDHLQVHGQIVNLFNSDAPVDLQTYGGGAELHYDAALHQDGAVGRFFMLGATYRF